MNKVVQKTIVKALCGEYVNAESRVTRKEKPSNNTKNSKVTGFKF